MKDPLMMIGVIEVRLFFASSDGLVGGSFALVYFLFLIAEKSVFFLFVFFPPPHPVELAATLTNNRGRSLRRGRLAPTSL